MRLATATLALSAVTATLACAVSVGAATKQPVAKLKHQTFGNVLVTPKRQALYFWNVEKRDFKVHCTGACAQAWPPLLVRSAKAVPKTMRGIKGTFGVISRPAGALQVTWNRLPIYTYAHEGPGQVLCDDVNGWFVVRI
jgi:predicted lipoprotein with Yx(FWY)xxD motif